MIGSKISILLPVFNEEQYIEESLKSVIDSSYKNFEIVVVDDGSTDSTILKIKNFNDPRVIVYSKTNSGLIESLNYGIKKCKNDIIMRMDGDDVLDINKIRKQIHAFESSKAILLGTDAYLFNQKGVYGEISLPRTHSEIVNLMLQLKPGIIHGTTMFYKSAIEKVGMYSDNLKHAEDFDLFLRLSKLGRLSNVNEKLYGIRKHNSNISHTNAKEQFVNTLVARKYYLTNNYKPISKDFFLNSKSIVLKNRFIRIYLKIHEIVVQKEFISKSNSFKLIPIKVLRRILNFFI